MSEPVATIIEKHPNIVVVRIRAARLDETNITEVRAETAGAGAESPELPVALDMSNIAFMPSLSLAGLIQLNQIYKARQQRLILAGLQPPIRQILAITRLDRLFEIHDDLSAVAGKPG